MKAYRSLNQKVSDRTSRYRLGSICLESLIVQADPPEIFQRKIAEDKTERRANAALLI